MVSSNLSGLIFNTRLPPKQWKKPINKYKFLTEICVQRTETRRKVCGVDIGITLPYVEFHLKGICLKRVQLYSLSIQQEFKDRYRSVNCEGHIRANQTSEHKNQLID